jgi:hypothetical protein
MEHDKTRPGEDGCYEATIQNVASTGSVLQLSVRLGDTPRYVLAHRSLDPIKPDPLERYDVLTVYRYR